MNSHSLPAQEVDYLEQNSSDGTPSGMSNGMTTANGLSPQELEMDTYQTPLSLAISKHSLVQDVRSFIEALRMSSPQASPVSHSPSPENKRERTTSGICGRQQPRLLGLSVPDSYCLKMCRESVDTCPWLSETCADLGMKFQDPSSLGLMTLGRRTGGKESGLWPTMAYGSQWNYPGASKNAGTGLATAVKMWRTPSATEADHGGPNARDSKGGLHLSAQVMWPTPRSGKTTDENEETWTARQKAGKVSTPPLTLAVKMRPTPTKQDGENNGGPSQYNRNTTPLSAVVKTWPTPRRQSANSPGEHGEGGRDLQTTIGGQLNPDWVEWLMGWPIGWSSLEPLTELRWLDWSVDPADVECEYDSADDSDYTFPRTNKRLPAGASRPTKPMIGRVTRKVAHRIVRLKALGNGQVPGVAATAWRLLTVSN